MDPFENFIVNLNSPGRGPITVLIAWMFVVAALGIFGHGDIAAYAMGLLGITGAAIFVALAGRS
jgi:hypothetical protein